MALPEAKPGEKVHEIDRDMFKLLEEAQNSYTLWGNEVTRLKRKIQEDMGDATAALVDDRLVATYRPRQTWRTTELIKDYPDLTQHYFVTETTTVFDAKRFAQVHPEVAEKYQTRAFEMK